MEVAFRTSLFPRHVVHGRRRGLSSRCAIVLAIVAACGVPRPSAAETGPEERPREAWNYVYSLGQRMQWFFRVRHQLRLVITGDSRATSADPMMFYSDSLANHDTPIAFSLSTGAIGFDCQEILLNEYIPHCPKLEWVVYQMSARLFNTHYHDTGIEALAASPGLAWDREHAETLWADAEKPPFRRRDVPYSPPTLSARYRDIRRWSSFRQALLAAAEGGGPARRIWDLLPEEAREALRASSEGDGRPASEEERRRGPTPEQEVVYAALNAIIRNPDFYRPEDFEGVALSDECRELLEKRPDLTEIERQRLNRFLIEAAFPNVIAEQHPIAVAWGGSGRRSGRTDPQAIPELIKICTEGRYTFDEDRWARFLKILDAYAARNVKVLGYVSPMHYGMAQAPCADDDGTMNPAYWALMHRLEDLTVEYPNFFFMDLHRNGLNDLKDEDYFNWDHVNSQGTEKVTRILEEFRRKIDAQGKLDVTPPRVAAVTAVGDPERVVVTFSEPVGAEGAADPRSYLLDDGAQVRAVALAEDRRTAALTTSPLAEAKEYRLRIKGVVDRFGNAVANPPAVFTFVGEFRAGAPSREGYVWGTLSAGMAAYVDGPEAVQEVPTGFEGLPVLRTAQRDKAEAGEDFLSFELNYPARVYVAHDDRIAMKPEWLGPDTYRYTWDFLKVGGQPLRLLWRDVPAGKVTLGGNGGAEAHMYLVIVRPHGACAPAK